MREIENNILARNPEISIDIAKMFLNFNKFEDLLEMHTEKLIDDFLHVYIYIYIHTIESPPSGMSCKQVQKLGVNIALRKKC